MTADQLEEIWPRQAHGHPDGSTRTAGQRRKTMHRFFQTTLFRFYSRVGAGLFTFALLSPVLPSAGTVYYVGPSGNDSNPGTASQPFRTIQKAARTATAGAQVLMQSGTYRERVLPLN